MFSKKKLKFSSEKIIVIVVAVAALMLMLGWITKDSRNKPDSSGIQRVVLSENGEASSINFEVPSPENSKNENGLLDTYEQFRMDSIQKSKNKDENTLFDDGNAYKNEDDPYLRNVQNQLQQMEREGMTNNSVPAGNRNTTDPLREKIEYQKMLLESKSTRAENNRDYSAGGTVSNNTQKGDAPALSSFEVRASIFRDQFILPGERVTLMLTEPLEINGNTFPKNTMLYAVSAIEKNRVKLDIININHEMVNLQAIDIDDGLEGIYNEKAGALWEKYKDEIQENVLQDAGRGIPGATGRIVTGISRAFGSFFRKKNIKKRDKILLINDDQVLLRTRTE